MFITLKAYLQVQYMCNVIYIDVQVQNMQYYVKFYKDYINVHDHVNIHIAI